MTHMEDDLITAKGSQKRKILSYGKALYKQTKREIYKISEENKRLKGENQRLTKENDSLSGKLASVDENAVRKLRSDLAAANQRAENADLTIAQEKERANQEWSRAEQERNRADNAEAKVREILSVPEIRDFWERILRQKAFLEEMNLRIGKAAKALYDFAKNRDLIFSNEAEDSIANGIIAEAILKDLDPTDEGQRKKAAKSLLGKVDWKGTYQSSCDLAETRTEQLCEEITVSKEIVATLLLAAGGKDHRPAVEAAVFADNGFVIAVVLNRGGGVHFDLHFEVQRLFDQLFGKLVAAHLNKAGIVFHLGGMGDLTAEAFFFNDQY